MMDTRKRLPRGNFSIHNVEAGWYRCSRERAKRLTPKLPRPGYETKVAEGSYKEVWLVNESGRFSVRVWYSVNDPSLWPWG